MEASRVIGDTAEVIMRRYTKPTEQAKAAAMAYLVTKFANLPRSAPNQRPETASEPRRGENLATTGRPSPAATGTYGTGPAGIEPATPRAERHPTSCILEEKARLRRRKKRRSERKSGQ